MLFFNRLQEYRNNICVIESNNKYYYKDLLELSDEYIDTIPTRSLVLILTSNTFDYLAIYIGLLKKKCVCILLDESINQNFLNKIINLYEPEFLFSNKQNNINGFSIIKNTSYSLKKTSYHRKKINKDLCLLLSTSGSTGSSKFVRISYNNLSSNTKSISKYLKISSSDRLITTLSPSYTYGFSQINTHLANGASIILNNSSFFEKNFWNLFETYKPNNFGGVPFSFEILKKVKFEKRKLKDLKYITQAGGKLNRDLHSWIADVCKKNNIKFYAMYGSTEATSRMSYLDWKISKKKLGSIGKPIPGGKMWLIDNKNRIIKKYFKQGKIVYKGKNVSMGYAENYKDLIKKDENKGYLVTGDVGYKDPQNFFFITGREKRFIKIFGNRINLDEIEDKLKEEGIICACNEKNDLLNMYIENKQKISAIEKFFSNKIIINRKYIKINLVKKIPRSSNGKIQYSKLS